jgi:hypothetical protein
MVGRSERAALAVLGVADKAGEEAFPAALASVVAAEARIKADMSKREDPVLVIDFGELKDDPGALPFGMTGVE